MYKVLRVNCKNYLSIEAVPLGMQHHVDCFMMPDWGDFGPQQRVEIECLLASNYFVTALERVREYAQCSLPVAKYFLEIQKGD